jgi:phosphoenolpyruvate carboxykinase (ATP)
MTELAWHGLFIRHLLRRPDRCRAGQLHPRMDGDQPARAFKADPARHGCRTETVIALNFRRRRLVLIGGTEYAGEIKKSIFTVMNYRCCPARASSRCTAAPTMPPARTDEAAVFFGLSGTGKTTLSAAPDRTLIGDDEHGWSDDGVFNFEGGCYAKTIDLSPEAEPDIYATTHRFGLWWKTSSLDPETLELDFDRQR